jgi:4a-hydroxytetrahydrobiopterin dehydratase
MTGPRPTDDLLQQHCKPCEAGMPPLARDAIDRFLARVPGWELSDGELVRTFSFKNYYQTVSFVNAVAWLAHREDHHPDMEFGYKTCTVRYCTHSIGGLSENDFICAAKINALAA